MTTNKFIGTGVAVITPFRNDGSVDFKSLEKIIEHLIENKVDYIVALGTTGESVTLTTDESEAIKNYVVDIVGKRVPVVLGIGGNSTQSVLSKIQNTDLEGIDGILSVSPYYNKPSQEGIYMHYKDIANLSPLPVIIYNVPSRTGSCISAETTLRLARDCKNIVATKEASGNLTEIMKIINNKPDDFIVISGDDALAFPIITMGGSGIISVTANAFPKEVSEMISLALKGETEKARNLHYRLIDFSMAIFKEGSPAGIKAVMKILNLTDYNLRLPLTEISGKLNKELIELVKQLK